MAVKRAGAVGKTSIVTVVLIDGEAAVLSGGTGRSVGFATGHDT